MSAADRNASSRTHLIGRGALALLLLMSGANPTAGADSEWTVLFEPMYMDAFGHDQHILTIHEVDLGAAPPIDAQTPVNLETEGGFAPRFEVQYTRGDWGLGLDFFWFDSSQGRPSRSAAATGPAAPVTFEVHGRTFTSDDPGEVLFFQVLEDTDVINWTVDLYGIRTLVDAPQGSLDLRFGLRNADFDNDYHSAVGIENVGGTLYDASSNYPRMIGPVLGVAGTINFGNSSVRGYLGQSVIFGSAELTNRTRDFVGPVSTEPNVIARTSIRSEPDVAIPITEFRLNWLYPVGNRFAVGVAANTSVWWDVPVPPGVIANADGGELFHENTLVYFGLAVAVQFKL